MLALKFYKSLKIYILVLMRTSPPEILQKSQDLHSSLDEDITARVPITNSTLSSLEGPTTRSRARHLNFEVRSFLILQPNIHEDGMLLKSCDVVLLRNMG